jgi:general nucleoside transport system permease protein
VSRARITGALLPVATSVLAAAAALAASLVVVSLSGQSPTEALNALWSGAFGNSTQLAGTLTKMVPLLLVSLGWVIAFSARKVNIGFEGQILAGGIVAAIIGLHVDLPQGLLLPLAVVGGIAGGAAWAGIAAWLWARRDVNEVISTLLLNFVAIQIVAWLVRGPLQEPTRQFNQTETLPAGAQWPHLMGQTLSWDFFLALAAVVIVWFVLSRTTFGFRLRATGSNPDTARHSGIKTVRVTVAALVISGGLAGLAGSSLILAGPTGTMADEFSANYGFDGIVVALLARNNPIACVPAALLFAALRQGSGVMEAQVGVPAEVVLITQGLVIVLIAGASLLATRRRRERVDRGGTPASGAATPIVTAPAVAARAPARDEGGISGTV